MQTRTLTRLQVNRVPMSQAAAVAHRVSDVLRMHNTPDESDSTGPLHVLLDVDPQEGSPLQRIDNATLIEKVWPLSCLRGRLP